MALFAPSKSSPVRDIIDRMRLNYHPVLLIHFRWGGWAMTPGELFKNEGLRRFFLAYLGFYVICGAIGALWVSDFYDESRAMFYGFVAIPLTVFFFFLMLQYPHVMVEAPHLFWGWLLVTVLAFGWGNVLLLNVLGGNKPTIVNMAIRNETMNFTYRQGGLGLFYRLRW